MPADLLKRRYLAGPAADFFLLTARRELAANGRLHAETAIMCMARMAGSLIYRSFDHYGSGEPGTLVPSAAANTEGPRLIQFMFLALEQLGSQAGRDHFDARYASAEFCQLSFRECHERLEPFFVPYCRVTCMTFREAAFAAAMATASLVHDLRNRLPVAQGSALAIYGVVEGAKTEPFPIPSRDVPPRPASPPPEAPAA